MCAQSYRCNRVREVRRKVRQRYTAGIREETTYGKRIWRVNISNSPGKDIVRCPQQKEHKHVQVPRYMRDYLQRWAAERQRGSIPDFLYGAGVSCTPRIKDPARCAGDDEGGLVGAPYH